MNKVRKIEMDVDDNGYITDVSFYFDKCSEAFTIYEFEQDSQTRIHLEKILKKLTNINIKQDNENIS